MANCYRFCMRFINSIAFLILLIFSSSSFAAYPGGGGGFGGSGAGGSWDEPDFVCKLTSTGRITGTGNNPSSACFDFFSKNGSTWLKMEMISTTSCQIYTTNNSSSIATPTCQKPVQCDEGYDYKDGKCVPKSCPVGQTLVNGQCKPKQCPAGQMLDANGQCMPPDDSCPAGQKKVAGKCLPKDDDEDGGGEGFELPPFCDWARVMCIWHEEWRLWSNEYAAYEEKANLDREELKRLSLDSKEYLNEINTNIRDSKTALDAIKDNTNNSKIKLDQIRDADEQFYDEIRLFLRNFNKDDGDTPSEQVPNVEFPKFCDWSVQICNWYLDWKDWRNDYNANNDEIKARLDAHLAKLEQIKQQDKTHHDESKSFFQDVRDFFSWYKNQADEDDPADPESPSNSDGNVEVQEQQITVDESSRITFDKSCPAGEHINVNIMGTNTSFEFSYQPLCTFMSMIRPFVIAIAYLIGAYILMGLSRGNAD